MEDSNHIEKLRLLLKLAREMRASPSYDTMIIDLIRTTARRLAEMSGDIRHKLRVVQGGRHD